MKSGQKRKRESLGSGKPVRRLLRKIGKGVIFEPGVRVLHPENIEIGNYVYIGHDTFINSYHKGEIIIGEGTWIGQGCFLHGAGGIRIGSHVGIAPHVKILTSVHEVGSDKRPVITCPLKFAAVTIKDGCDIGIGSIVLPGVTIGEGSVIGAGSVVTKDIPDYTVWAGSPARMLRKR
jgi:acetyltransferase-like isoleucine patch superfamily enzyme